MPVYTSTPTDLFGRPTGETITYTTRSSHDDYAPVPTGTVRQVLAWVGYDPERAKAALLAEHAADHQRRGLIGALERRMSKEQ